MSAPAFTPGPWKVFRASNGKLLGIGDAEAGGVTDAYGGLWRSGEEMEANARLIAAAPELYAELEQWLFLLDSGQIKGNGLHSFSDRSRALLAKARGEQ